MEALFRFVSGVAAGIAALFAPIGPLAATTVVFIGVDFLSGVAADRAAALREGRAWYFESCKAWRTVLKLALALTAISMAWLIDSCVLDFMRLNLARLLTGFTCGVELWSFLENAAQLSDAPLFRCSAGCAATCTAASGRRQAMSRGLSNCNPGNIRQSKVRYKGEVQPSRDPAFKQFESLAWGYRAVFVLLHTYRVRHGLRTVRGMISRWAPPVENHTEAYIRAVAADTGIDPDEPLDTLDPATMIPLAAAISRVENGTAADRGEIERGWALFSD